MAGRDHAEDTAPEAHEPPQQFYERGPRAGTTPPGSAKVGWTLRDSSNKILDAVAFLINPQGITRIHGSRSTVQATKGGHYVDDFGPAPTSIMLRQLVASGRVITNAEFTAREDVQRFLKQIYLPATVGPDKKHRRVFFHDHHFERGFEERIHFPAQSLTIDRDVSLHNIWRLEIQMISLEKYPYAEIEVEKTDTTRANGSRQYRVVEGDTLTKIANRIAGKGASAAKRRRVLQKILKLNPFLSQLRRRPGKSAEDGFARLNTVYPGDKIRLPA